MRDEFRFIARFVRHPLAVGAIAPSSRWLARAMVRDMGLEEARAVVELGPGTGAFTGEIAGTVGSETRFLALEIDEPLARALEGKFPRAEVIHDSAEHIRRHLAERDLQAADAILCGLPWASFPAELQERIMSAVLGALAPGGRFATFAYLHASWFPTARRFGRWLRARFSSVETTRTVWRNLPPAFIYRCEK